MEKELRIIRIPRTFIDGGDVEVSPEELMLVSMLLRNKFGGVSAVTIGILAAKYNLSNDNVAMLRKLVPVVAEKGLVNITAHDDKIGKHTLLEVEENIEEGQKYITIDFNLIERILMTDKRFDTKAIAVHTLLVLQSRAGYKDMRRNTGQKGYCYPSIVGLAEDVGVSKQPIENSLNLLAELDIIEIINQGHYVTTNKEGKEIVKSYPNAYIIKQITYTERDILSIKAEVKAGLQQVKDKAEDDKVASHYYSDKSGDDYNINREEERERLDNQIHTKAQEVLSKPRKDTADRQPTYQGNKLCSPNYRVSKEEDLARDDNGDLIVF